MQTSMVTPRSRASACKEYTYGLLSVRIERNEGPDDSGGQDSSNSPGQIVRNEAPGDREGAVDRPLARNSSATRLVTRDDLPKKLDEYLTRMTSFRFSGGVLIGKDDRVLSNKAYGMADRANSIPNTTETLRLRLPDPIIK